MEYVVVTYSTVTFPAVKGGIIPPKKPSAVTRYTRGMFGVTVVVGVGLKALPLNYTNRLAVDM